MAATASRRGTGPDVDRLRRLYDAIGDSLIEAEAEPAE